MLEEKEVVEEQQEQEDTSVVVDAQETAVEEEVDEAKENQSQPEQPVSNEDISDEEIDSSDAPQSLKTALKRANRRLRKERQSRAKLEDRLNSVESKFSQIDSKQEGDELLKELQSELGLEPDQTQKFYKAVDRIVEKRNQSNTTNNTNSTNGNLTPKQSQFVERSSKEMQFYPEEDRAGLSQYAQKAIEAEMKQLQSLGLDPNDVLDDDPRTYIQRGYKQMMMDSASNNRIDSINKSNGHNRATTESSRDGVKKPSGQTQITQNIFEKNRGNSEWVAKNREAIMSAARKGIIRGR